MASQIGNENSVKRKKNDHHNDKKKVASDREYKGGDESNLLYKSGIPTLRASAHRVKFSVKNRKHNPKTKHKTLPKQLLVEDIHPYDCSVYNLKESIVQLLLGCDNEIVGSFQIPVATEGGIQHRQQHRLEDFRVPVSSVWRSVNGGNCEDAQKYLSDRVRENRNFLDLFDKFVSDVALPYVKNKMVECGSLESTATPCAFYYQRPPTIRLQPGPGWAKVKPHNDAEYGHQNGEINMWVPLTDRILTGVDLWCESSFQAGDYHPIKASVGEIIVFHGSSVRHYVNANRTRNTRVSFDFRIGIQDFFDHTWEMQGTTDDHTRQKVLI